MIKTIDLFDVCSRVEQSNQAKERGKSHGVSPMNGSLAGRQPERNAAEPQRRRDTDGRIGKALDYMLQHLEKPIHIAALGKIAGMSASHFYPLFKTATGCTPNDFFIRARMRRASELLRSTHLSVKEVAAALGYDDQFYFSRVFKLVNGVPPREYRILAAGLEYSPKNTPQPFDRKNFQPCQPFPGNCSETNRISRYRDSKSHPTNANPVRKPTQPNKTNR